MVWVSVRVCVCVCVSEQEQERARSQPSYSTKKRSERLGYWVPQWNTSLGQICLPHKQLQMETLGPLSPQANILSPCKDTFKGCLELLPPNPAEPTQNSAQAFAQVMLGEERRHWTLGCPASHQTLFLSLRPLDNYSLCLLFSRGFWRMPQTSYSRATSQK